MKITPLSETEVMLEMGQGNQFILNDMPGGLNIKTPDYKPIYVKPGVYIPKEQEGYYQNIFLTLEK